MAFFDYRHNKVLNQNRYIICLFVCTLPLTAFAFEPYALQPGTRAAAMAGVFSPQADDSSAIWYNPAGLKRKGAVATDIAIDIAQMASQQIDPSQSNDSPQYGDSNTSLRFAGAYADHIPWLTDSDGAFGTGLAYMTLYQLQINVDEPRSLIDPTPFGLVEANYRQVSFLLSSSVNNGLSLGATVDAVWSSISCLQYQPCVENDPAGIGASIGAMVDVFTSEAGNIKLGATWRSKADVSYSGTSNSGIGTVLESYLPARPETRNFSLNLQIPAAWAFMNVNLMAERVLWSKAAAPGQALPDYTNIGFSTELLFTQSGESSWAVRGGYKNSRSYGEHLMPSADTWAFGGGYLFLGHHAVDLAYEARKMDASGENTTESVSLSYSLQY